MNFNGSNSVNNIGDIAGSPQQNSDNHSQQNDQSQTDHSQHINQSRHTNNSQHTTTTTTTTTYRVSPSTANNNDPNDPSPLLLNRIPTTNRISNRNNNSISNRNTYNELISSLLNGTNNINDLFNDPLPINNNNNPSTIHASSNNWNPTSSSMRNNPNPNNPNPNNPNPNNYNGLISSLVNGTNNNNRNNNLLPLPINNNSTTNTSHLNNNNGNNTFVSRRGDSINNSIPMRYYNSNRRRREREREYEREMRLNEIEDEEDLRSRSRNNNRNTNATRLDIVLPVFNGIIEIIDRYEAENIYKLIYRSESNLPNNIMKEIAEFAIGELYVCNYRYCNYEILLLNSGVINGLYFNPSINILEDGFYDVNDNLIIFCQRCMNNTKQCKLKLEPYEINNMFGGGNFIITGGIQTDAFKEITCTNRLIGGNNTNYCFKCRNGRRLTLSNGDLINIKCGMDYQSYRNGNSFHKYYDYGTTTHSFGGM